MYRFSFKKLGCLLFLFLFVLQAAAFAQEAFTIEDYRVDVNAKLNRTYSVQEKLTVNFTQPRHGIIRAIPAKSSVEDYKIKNASADQKFSKKRSGELLNIQIGDPDAYVNGIQNYTISYDLVHIKDDATDGDYLYMNLIGQQWDTSIANAVMTIHLPTDQILDVTVTTGRYGAKESNASYQVNGSEIVVTAQDLKNYEGVTIMVKMPQDTFYEAPENFYPLAGTLVMFLLAGAVVLVLLTAVCFFRHGRDAALVRTPEFYPPEDLSPAELGYVIDRECSQRDATSLIFFWASRGYLTYEQTGKNTYTLHKKQNMDDSRPEYERKAFDRLWALGDGEQVNDLQLQNHYYQQIGRIQTAIPQQFSGEKALDDSHAASLSSLCNGLGVIAPLLLLLYSFFVSDLMLFGVMGAILYLVVYFGCTASFKNQMNRKAKNAASATVLQIVSAGVLLGLSIVGCIGVSRLQVFDLLPMLAVFLLCGICGLWSVYINRRSEYGTRILERAIGFKDFLNTAEKSKLELLLKENSSYFYDILPYALVLGVTGKWAEKFDGLITQPPEWYHSRYDVFTTIWLWNSMNHSFRSTQNVLASTPPPANGTGGSSGSFGGGGFSGGGSGGGGGSSW